MTTNGRSLFERRLEENLQDPEFRDGYQREMREIARVQDLLARLDAAREEAGLSKADLARASGTHPAAVRKLLSSGRGNPTLRKFLVMLDEAGLDLKVVRRQPRRSRGREDYARVRALGDEYRRRDPRNVLV